MSSQMHHKEKSVEELVKGYQIYRFGEVSYKANWKK